MYSTLFQGDRLAGVAFKRIVVADYEELVEVLHPADLSCQVLPPLRVHVRRGLVKEREVDLRHLL